MENPAAPNTHVHACNYTHFIRRGSPVFHFVEFTKGRLPLRRVRMINDDMFFPRTGMTVPCHSMMLAMSHICLLAGLRKLKIAPSSFPLDFQLTPECWHIIGFWTNYKDNAKLDRLILESFLSVLAVNTWARRAARCPQRLWGLLKSSLQTTSGFVTISVLTFCPSMRVAILNWKWIMWPIVYLA